MLKTGDNFNIVITACGEVYSWGKNEKGQLGLGNYGNQNIPLQINFLKDKQIKEIKCGNNHTIAITDTSDIYSWGCNDFGQLGLGNNNNQNIPQLVEFFKDKQRRGALSCLLQQANLQIKEIKCGADHTIANTENGEVYSWGYNNEGQLGLGHNNNQNVPQLVDFFKDKQIKEIICGGYHTFAITDIGKVYSWGYNDDGQLGLGSRINQNIPQQVEFFKNKQIKEIKCGGFHTIAIIENGEVYSWGFNYDGELGLGHNNDQNIPQLVDFFKDKQIKEIICGKFHTFAITENGDVYSWGYNCCGQLGLSYDNNQYIPQQVDFLKDKQHDSRGALSCLLQQANLQIKKIICGGKYTFAITDNSEVYSWGNNDYGQLGLGNDNNQNVPRLVDFFKEHPIFTRISKVKSARSTTFNS